MPEFFSSRFDSAYAKIVVCAHQWLATSSSTTPPSCCNPRASPDTVGGTVVNITMVLLAGSSDSTTSAQRSRFAAAPLFTTGVWWGTTPQRTNKLNGTVPRRAWCPVVLSHALWMSRALPCLLSDVVATASSKATRGGRTDDEGAEGTRGGRPRGGDVERCVAWVLACYCQLPQRGGRKDDPWATTRVVPPRRQTQQQDPAARRPTRGGGGGSVGRAFETARLTIGILLVRHPLCIEYLRTISSSTTAYNHYTHVTAGGPTTESDRSPASKVNIHLY